MTALRSSPQDPWSSTRMHATAIPVTDRAVGAGRSAAPVGASPSYMVAWRGSDGALARGSARLEGSLLILRGSTEAGSVVRRRVPLADIAAVRIGRAPSERVQGTRSVVLDLRDGGELAVAPVGAGQVFELAELVAELSAAQKGSAQRVAVVLPLRAGTADKARELVSGGPPFDLSEAGLDAHHVFVTEREAVFVFEGPAARETLERLSRSPRVLREAGRWADCLAGRPRLADETYAWRREA
jgi:hypothetical protein